MSVAGIASNLTSQAVAQSFFFQRRTDLAQLGQAINSGDLAQAQQVYSALTALGRNIDGYKPFKNSVLERDFLAVGQALQAGDAAGAQKAFATLQQDIQKINFRGKHPSQAQPQVEAFILELIQARDNNAAAPRPPASVSPPPVSSTTPPPAPTPSATGDATPAASTPEIVINLGANGTSGESTPEVVVNLTSGNGSGSNPELTIEVNNATSANGPSSSNPEVVLNLGSSNPEIAFNFGNSGGNGLSLAEIVLNLNGGGTQPQTSGIQINVVA